MAKSSIFAVLLSLLSLTTKAQNPSSYYVEEPRTFYGGLLLGGNFTQVDGDNFAGYHKVGLNAGGIVYANLADHLAASLEILFSQKGSRAHKAQEVGSQGEVILQQQINLNYAEVPIQLNYFDKRRSHFGAGFSYSQLISAKESIETNYRNRDNVSDTFKFRKMDINFIIGGNLHLWKGLFLNARFQYSLIPIRKKEDNPPGFGPRDQFSNVWAVRLMYLF